MARPPPAAALEAPRNPGSADTAGGRRDGQDAVLAAAQFGWLISLGHEATLTPLRCRRSRLPSPVDTAARPARPVDNGLRACAESAVRTALSAHGHPGPPTAGRLSPVAVREQARQAVPLLRGDVGD